MKTLVKIDADDAYRIPSFKFRELTDLDKKKIERSRYHYVLSDSVDLSFLTFPGLIFSSHLAAKGFDGYVMSKTETFPNSPRGNLSRSNVCHIIGYTPGHNFDESFKQTFQFKSCAWDFGPSTFLLHEFLLDVGVYPYFSNIFQTKEDFESKNLSTIINEIQHLVKLHSIVYAKKSIDIFLLGNYDEYYTLCQQLRNQIWIQRFLKVNVYRIWHPSYLLRAFSDQKVELWKSQFLKKTNRMM